MFTLKAQIVSGKIYNKNTLKPIDKVAIITRANRGSTSDKNGNFTIDIKNITSVTFSSLGFETLTLSIKDLKKLKFNVSLVEKVNELDEIQLNLAKISLDSILVKTQRNMLKSFISGATENHFYAKTNSEINFKKLDLKLKKSTLLNNRNKKLATKELIEYISNFPDYTSEFKGILLSKKIYSKELKRNIILNNIKSIDAMAASTNNENISIKSAQSKLQNIILKHLDTAYTYKVSSGLFKVEDSLSLEEIIKKTDSLTLDNTFGINNNSYLYNDALYNALFFTKKYQYNFLDSKYYQHQFNPNELLANKMYYSVNFTPNKSKSKFCGKILINPEDFTIAKIEYHFADRKRGENINFKWLLGIKAAQNICEVVIYYEKNKNNKLYMAYTKETIGTYAYIHRPIKFKENSKEKNKVKLDIKMEVNINSTKEFFISDTYSIDETKIKPLKKEDYSKRKKFLSKELYYKTNWKNRQLITNYLISK